MLTNHNQAVAPGITRSLHKIWYGANWQKHLQARNQWWFSRLRLL